SYRIQEPVYRPQILGDNLGRPRHFLTESQRLAIIGKTSANCPPPPIQIDPVKLIFKNVKCCVFCIVKKRVYFALFFEVFLVRNFSKNKEKKTGSFSIFC
ncbi:MAG: hypothetical protein LBN18_06330, partial [Dysgonamonadaceae bacterium]|nr:hypothetical protein [Dysgonamonadaceae bacterium]